MAKEITHILIAQDALTRLKDAGQGRLARIIETHLGAFFLGAMIPDAVFYDVPPFCLNPTFKHLWIAKDLHQAEFSGNDDKAMSFLRTIAIQPSGWPLKLAFAAGVVTHTAVDRVFHQAIDVVTATRQEGGYAARTIHHEIETLVDMLLLRARNMTPRRFFDSHPVRLDGDNMLRLCHLYLSHVMGAGRVPGAPLLHVLKRAYGQQCFFLKVFATRSVRLLITMFNHLMGGRLQAWHSLFYPAHIEPAHFPGLLEVASESSSSGIAFMDDVKGLEEAAVEEAVRNIRTALVLYG